MAPLADRTGRGADMRAPARHHTPDAPDGIAVWRVALGGLLVIAAVTTATFWLVPVAGLLALGRRCWLWRWELLTVTVAVFLIGYGLSAMGLALIAFAPLAHALLERGYDGHVRPIRGPYGRHPLRWPRQLLNGAVGP